MMLTSLSSKDGFGRAFGVERAGDNVGAIIGPLLASALVGIIGIRHAILLSFLPGILAAVAITIAAREARRTLKAPPGRTTLRLNLSALRTAGIARTLTPVALFEFGDLATTLLILRATDLLVTSNRDLTAATAVAILLYTAHNGAATVMSLLGGQLADRIGPRAVFTAGAAVYIAAYVILPIGPTSWPILLLAFLLAGVGIGFAETAESTVIAQQLPDHRGQRVRGPGSDPIRRRPSRHRRRRSPLGHGVAGACVLLRRHLDARLRPRLPPAVHQTPGRPSRRGLTDRSPAAAPARAAHEVR